MALAQDDRRVKDFDNSDFVGLSIELLSIAQFFGVKTPPSPNEIISITVFIGAKYKWITKKEIRKAFEFLVTGDLEYFDGDKWIKPSIEHYNSFTIKYIGPILTHYQKCKRDKLKDYNRMLRKIESDEESEQLERKYWENYKSAVVNRLSKYYTDFIEEGNVDFEDESGIIYNRLKFSNLIKLSLEEMNDIKDQAEELVPVVPNFRHEKYTAFKKQRPQLVQDKCYKLALQMQFDKWQDNGVEIDTIIKKIDFSEKI